MADKVASGIPIARVALEYGIQREAVFRICKLRGVRTSWPRGRPKKKRDDLQGSKL